MHTNLEREMTAVELAELTGKTVDLFRIKYSAFRREGHPLFAGEFSRNTPLSIEQINALNPSKQKINKVGDSMIPKTGPVKVSAPQKVKSDWVGVAALAVAFLIPTLASAFNTYNVSHQVAKDWRVAMFIMVMVMFTPALFIVARMNWAGAFVAFGVVIFEGFCNLSAIYLSLMGNMEYILDGKRGVCSDFLQSVVNLTNSDHRPTAVLIGGALAALIALTQLTAFWAIRNRLK